MSDNGEEGYEEISAEEKLQIAQHYLLSSPPGQFNEVLTGNIARVGNLKASKVVTAPSGNKALITPAAEVETNNYVDPISQTVFAVDHLTLATRPSDLSPPSSHLDDVRAALQVRLTSYSNASYHPTEARAAGVYLSATGGLTLVVTGERASLKNFWSGRWTSVWTLSVNEGGCTLAGELKIHVHYFEDGNLQMQSTKTFAAVSLPGPQSPDLAAKVVGQIQAHESAYQAGLEDMYSNMNSETIKAMRRVMPITKTKMDWNVNAVRMVRQVRK
eukprot:gene27282-32954_t